MKQQKTIIKKASISGIGVHTGSKTTMIFQPAPVDNGIKFIRIDLPDKPVIKAGIESVVETARGTILGNGSAKVHTVEHVMAALWAYGITNLNIELDAEEPPVGDGSSNPFINMLEEAGIEKQDKSCVIYKVTSPIKVTLDDTFLAIFPYDGFKMSYTLSYDHQLVTTQYANFELDKETFIKEISPCRTFCFYREVEALMDKGLIQGGSLENAVVIGDEAILSKEGLRFENEFARHKILDLIGDLYLLGIRLEGHVIAMKSGHSLNVKLAQTIKDITLNPSSTITTENQKSSMNIEEIKKILPHRYPFLLVDRIVNISENGAVGIKNVSSNEEFFNGHFPQQALMPGVLQIEAMAQVAGIRFLHNKDIKGQIATLAGVTKARFRRPVIPGDQLVITVERVAFKRGIGKASATIKVDNKLVSEADLIFALMEGS